MSKYDNLVFKSPGIYVMFMFALATSISNSKKGPEYIRIKTQIDSVYEAKRDSMENASRFQLDSLKNNYQVQLDSLESKFE